MVKTHILIEMIKDNPFNDDTTADEKYQFTCMIDFRRVFRDRANLERINFRDGDFFFFFFLTNKNKNTLFLL